MLIAFILASNAFAYPSVGDSAQYTGTLNCTANCSSASPISIQLNQSITAINTVGTTTTATVTTTTVANGQTQTETQPQNVANMMGNAQIAQMLQTCTSIGGKTSNLTVAAGTFVTCAVTPASSNSTLYYANVPFGIVRMVNAPSSLASVTHATNGQTWVMNADLTSVHSGN